MKITPALESELERVIHALPGDDLVALARTEPDFLAGGFRASNAAALRTRARLLATGSQPLSDSLRRLLARHSFNAGCVRLLSAAALSEQRASLSTLFGEPRLLLGMLLDERPEIQELAHRWLQQGAPPPLPEPAAAVAQAREAFGTLLGAMGASGDAGSPPALTREVWQAAREQLEQQLREARAEMRRLKGVEDRLARTRDQLAAAERATAAAAERATAAEILARQTGRERDAARAELEREVNHREARLTAALETRLAEEAVGWLSSAHAVAREAAALPPAGGDDPLLARATAALARQAAIDRHSGNRATLAARLDLLDLQLAQVRDVLAHALQTAPELAAVERDLGAEAARLRCLLDRNETPALETALAARFATAAPDHLLALRSLVDQLGSIGALDAAAVGRLTGLLQRRQEVAHATTAPAGTLPEDDSPPGLLRQSLAGLRPGVLLVDGHNILFGLQGRYLPPSGGVALNASTRTRLIDDIVRLTGGHPSCRAWIVFDGPAHTENSAAENVRITFSGGTGEHRADLVLLDNVRFFRATGNTAVILASNDNALGAEARRLGAHVISALELGALLG